MQEDFAEAVYLTLCGQLAASARIDGVEDAFREGSPCSQWYSLLLEARDRLLERLGVPDDDDLEMMLVYQLMIQEALCHEMFHYGATLSPQ